MIKVQSCKLNSSKYIIASAQTANTAAFIFTADLVFKLMSHKQTGKDNRNCQKVGYFLRNSKFHKKITARLYLESGNSSGNSYCVSA